MSFKNFKTHLKTINKHKFEVMKLCFKAGLYKQGILHDLSKYSLTELKTGWKYADGRRSPIDNEIDDIGYSASWLNHLHKNKHHYEYWFNANQNLCYDMPINYIYEAVLDRVAAAKTYQKDEYTNKSAYDYFMNSKFDPVMMGEWNAARVAYILKHLCNFGEESLVRKIKCNFFEDFLNDYKESIIKEFKTTYYK